MTQDRDLLCDELLCDENYIRDWMESDFGGVNMDTVERCQRYLATRRHRQAEECGAHTVWYVMMTTSDDVLMRRARDTLRDMVLSYATDLPEVDDER